MSLLSTPRLLETRQVTVRFALGTTVSLYVITPLLYWLWLCKEKHTHVHKLSLMFILFKSLIICFETFVLFGWAQSLLNTKINFFPFIYNIAPILEGFQSTQLNHADFLSCPSNHKAFTVKSAVSVVLNVTYTLYIHIISSFIDTSQ